MEEIFKQLFLNIFMILYEPVKILFKAGPFSIHSWGFMLAIAFLVAFFLVLREAKKKKINTNHVYVISLLLLVGTLVGPRLFYVFEHLSYYLSSPLEIFAIWQGGETSYGAFLGLLFVWLYVKKQKLKFLEILDLFVPYIVLAMAITRIGCFLNWCCYGIQSNLPWAIQVSNDVSRHPTQIYMFLVNLMIFILLINFKKIRQNRKTKRTRFNLLIKKPASLFFLFLLVYSFVRFFIDFLREYEYTIFGLALSQWLCIAIFVFAIIFLKARTKTTH